MPQRGKRAENPLRGLFITFEGCDGSGKSTQIDRLVKRLAREGFHPTVTREPGGTEFGEIVRRVLLDPQGPDRTALAELFLYSASRAELVSRVIKPALDQGNIVIAERYVDSTWVYQGYAGGLSVTDVEVVNKIATGNLYPDLTLVLDVSDPLVIHNRLAFKQKDKIESRTESYHAMVREGYRRLARLFGDRIKLVDASVSIDEVEERIWTHVLRALKDRGYNLFNQNEPGRE